MSVWAVTMVRDEIDIIPFSMFNMIVQGVNGIIVADHGSRDGTRHWLKNFDPNCHYHLHDLHDPTFNHSRVLTELANEAFAAGADWVIPFDADELWHAGQDHLIDELLNHIDPAVGVVYVRRYTHYPTTRDDISQLNPFRASPWRDPVPTPPPKIIVHRNTNFVAITRGAHDIEGHRGSILYDNLMEVAHCPVRSAIQFERKVRNIHQICEASDGEPDVCDQWLNYNELFTDCGLGALKEVFECDFLDPPQILQLAAVPA